MKYITLTILSLSLFLAVPVFAENTSSSTPDIVIDEPTPTSTPDIVTNDDTTPTSTPDIGIEDSMPTSTPEIVMTTSHLTIRNENTVVFDADISLTTTTYHDAINNTDYPLETTSTVFSILVLADNESDTFNISDAQYNDWFQSFYVNCLTLESTTTTVQCGNWKYTVNGAYPYVGMDAYELAGNESIYIYFGDRFALTISTSSIAIDETVTSTLQEYDFSNNVWLPASGAEILATEPILPDYSNWPPTTIQSGTTDGTGTVAFTFSATGTYYITIPNDYWPGATIDVIETTVTTSETLATSTTSNSGGSGCGNCGGTTAPSFNISNAITFLHTLQNPDGSFGTSPFYADWVAIAYGAHGGTSNEKTKLISYLLTNPNEQTGPNTTTNYARRAMALMALGINPYDGAGKDFIIPLVATFDGTQFGDASLVNDDIFALFPLLKAGYSTDDEIIAKTVSFILSQQSGNGSFDSIDMTSAGIQALSLVSSRTGVADAITKARSYLVSVQQSDGGFENAESTSWTMQAISALGESPTDWTKNAHTPLSFLTEEQQLDGGLRLSTDSVNNRLWSTAYAIPAVLGKPWNEILYSFSKPIVSDATKESSSIGASKTETPTSTSEIIENSTTTTIDIVPIELDVATTTIEINMVTSTLEMVPTEPVILEQLTNERQRTTNEAQQFVLNNQRLETKNQESEPEIDQSEFSTSSSQISDFPASAGSSHLWTESVRMADRTMRDKLQISPTSTSPIAKTAREIFFGSAGLAGGLGLYLGWRLLQTLI